MFGFLLCVNCLMFSAVLTPTSGIGVVGGVAQLEHMLEVERKGVLDYVLGGAAQRELGPKCAAWCAAECVQPAWRALFKHCYCVVLHGDCW